MFNKVINSNYWQRFKNPATIIALVGAIGLLLNQFGLDVDLEWLDTTTKIFCTILVILGIANNPETKGIDLPKKGANENGGINS